MKNPGVWILGETNDRERKSGLGIVIEYAGKDAAMRNGCRRARAVGLHDVRQAARETPPAERLPLVFEKIFAGHRWVDKWSINGKSYPKTDPIRVRAHGRYRLVFDNRSDEAHPVHLHRHTFELTKVEGAATSGVFKDVVVVRPKSKSKWTLSPTIPASVVSLPPADAYGLWVYGHDAIYLKNGSARGPEGAPANIAFPLTARPDDRDDAFESGSANAGHGGGAAQGALWGGLRLGRFFRIGFSSGHA